MITPKATTLAALLLSFAASASAQAPLRPNGPTRAVTLTLAEYNRLLDLASRPSAVTSVAPVAAVVASADLRVRVDRGTARGVFSVTGEVLRAGVSKVSLLSGATLVDANAGGRPIPLIADGPVHTALVTGPGPFAITLEWGAPLAFAPGRASFVLPVPQAGTARATIDLPGEQADVHLSSGLVTRRSFADGRTVVEATLDPGSATEVRWSMRDSAPTAAAREVRALADVMTLVTLGDSDVRMVALLDVTVVQGELRTLPVRLPSGYELTSISGSSLESSEAREDGLVLTFGDPAARSHQVLMSLERAHAGGSFTLDTGFVVVRDVQRERGEVAIEGVGTLELAAAEREGMHRIDVRELNQALQSLARLPLLSAFRYQRTATTMPSLSLEVKRFADAGVLAAVADRATATTLVTSEGRALTEITLTVQNRAQPFMKVTLPAGASMVSVEVAGETAKPVLGVDGTRVPLLRPGFRPNGPYQVSFVYLLAGTPFARKGDLQMTLPRMDVPVSIVEWEVFVPDRYSARAIGGNAIDLAMVGGFPTRGIESGVSGGLSGSAGGSSGGFAANDLSARVRISMSRDQPRRLIRGRVTDVGGGVLPGVTILLESSGSRRSVVTGPDGTFQLPDVLAGHVTVTASSPGFTSQSASFAFDETSAQADFELPVAGVNETVTVAGHSPRLDRQQLAQPSQNVISLQRRTAGVLPIRVDVPRAGTSHQFVKPLVVDQETVVQLRYRRK